MQQQLRFGSLAKMLAVALVVVAVLSVIYVYWPGKPAAPGEGFTVPPNSSVSLTWRNNLTGNERSLPLEALPGQAVHVFIGERQAGQRSLDDLFAEGLKSPPRPPDAAEERAGALRAAFGIAVVEDAVLSTVGSRFRFQYMESTSPVMQTLRQRERLDAVVAGATSEFDKFCRLLLWVRAQLTEGVPNPYPPFNALVILDMVRSGRTEAFCGQYAQVLVQSLISLGYQARYVGLESHEVLEVWSNEHVKWVLLDPYNGWYFRRAGKPLSTLEVHDLVCASRANEIELVRLDTAVTRDPARQLEQYRMFNVSMVNNHPELGGTGVADVEAMWHRRVWWIDEHTTALPIEDGRLRMMTALRTDVYFNINTVGAAFEVLERGVILVRLSTFTPELARLERKLGDRPWEATAEAFEWHLDPGRNTLRLRAVNVQGVTGPESRFAVDYVPSPEDER